jgi:hypothetical protein
LLGCLHHLMRKTYSLHHANHQNHVDCFPWWWTIGNWSVASSMKIWDAIIIIGIALTSHLPIGSWWRKQMCFLVVFGCLVSKQALLFQICDTKLKGNLGLQSSKAQAAIFQSTQIFLCCL